MTTQERHVACQMLSDFSSGTYIYYATMSDEELVEALSEFGRKLESNSAGEVG
jgi:hypothetical protein